MVTYSLAGVSVQNVYGTWRPWAFCPRNRNSCRDRYQNIFYGKGNTFFKAPTAYFRISVTDSFIGLVVPLCDNNNCSYSIHLKRMKSLSDILRSWVCTHDEFRFHLTNWIVFMPHNCLLLQACIILLMLESSACIEGLLTATSNWTMSQKNRKLTQYMCASVDILEV